MRRYPLPRSERIIDASDFKSIFRSGRAYGAKDIKIIVLRNNFNVSRIGVSIGRSCAKLAVERNRARRLLKEAFRLNKGRFKPGYDIVAVPKSGLAGLKLKDLEGEFVELAKRAGIFNEELKSC